MPAEIRQRLGRVRGQLERQAARAVADASTITLRADGMRLSQIIAAFQRQSGNADHRRPRPVRRSPAANRCLNVRFDKTPSGPRSTGSGPRPGLTVYPYAERRAIEIRRRRGGDPPRRSGRVCYAGPLRIEASRGCRPPRAPPARTISRSRLPIEVALGAAGSGHPARPADVRRHGDRDHHRPLPVPTPRPSSRRPGPSGARP